MNRTSCTYIFERRRLGTEENIVGMKAAGGYDVTRGKSVRKLPAAEHARPAGRGVPLLLAGPWPGDTIVRPSAPIEPRVRYSRPIRTCSFPRYFGRNNNVNSNLNKMKCMGVNMSWFFYIIVSVLVNKPSAQDIFETGELPKLWLFRKYNKKSFF